MKVLTVDIGNTSVDACLWEGGKPKPLGRVKHSEIEKLKGPWDVVVAVSVKKSLEGKLYDLFEDRLKIIRLEDIPLEVDYETPQTLGVDRVLFAYTVKEVFQRNDALCLMCGTALVLDLLKEGKFSGGFITLSPPNKVRSLSQIAEGIPPLDFSPVETALGKSTRECILGGVLLESKAFVSYVKNLWKLDLFITGGCGHLFKDLGYYDPIALHRGLYKLL